MPTAVAPALPRAPRLTPHKRRILIVDDHEILRCGWHYLISVEDDLEICGEAGTVQDALDLLEPSKPDIVVTDLLLPDRNGLELVRELHTTHPEIPVLVVSMYDERIYCERVLRAGACGYVMKEAASDQLVNAIRRVLSGRHYVSEALLETLMGESVRQTHPTLPLNRLTNREMEVFELIGQGLSQDDISKHLGIKPRTVEAHRTNIRKKLGLRNSKELLTFAVRYYQSGLAPGGWILATPDEPEGEPPRSGDENAPCPDFAGD
jgi:DNA-binding NarL/FixJ family response regulator